MKLNKITSYFFLAFIGISSVACSQTKRSIAFYNVENLFDTQDDPKIDDAEFLPSAEREWNNERYNEKLKHINEVFELFNSPLIIGICEIENEQVVRDIVNYDKLKANYGVVHYESIDERGIDVALIYDSTSMKLIQSGIIRYNMPEGDRPSRDIVWGKFLFGKDTIMGMVNHWPSRSGGEEASEPKRMIAATAAREFIDSVQKYSPKTMIAFMGDLNDYPTNNSAKLIAELLTPMITKESGEYKGSYNYRGEWDVLDHIMISANFFSGKKVKAIKDSGKIYSNSFLLEVYKGDTVPFRTYGGKKYLGGYSDHLPVSIELGYR
ncbi:MAG: endonuclease [Crocinitomicaceae bacterium]